jgi:hypothetical protein
MAVHGRPRCKTYLNLNLRMANTVFYCAVVAAWLTAGCMAEPPLNQWFVRVVTFGRPAAQSTQAKNWHTVCIMIAGARQSPTAQVVTAVSSQCSVQPPT